METKIYAGNKLMKEKEPGVMLAPNDCPDLDLIPYPMLTSVKMDGVRGIVKNGQMLSRTFKPFGASLTRQFQPMIDAANRDQVVLDFEIWSPKLSFTEIMSAIAHPEQKHELRLYVFDQLSVAEWYGQSKPTPFQLRASDYQKWITRNDPSGQYLQPVEQRLCSERSHLDDLFKIYEGGKLEGFMLKSPYSFYKHGRTTMREGTFYKWKQWVTTDARIVGFKQGTQSTEAARAEESRDVLGHLKRSHRQGDRELADRLGSIEVEVVAGSAFTAGTRCFVTLAKEGKDLRSKITWDNCNSYLGRHVEIVFQEHGSKDKPRIGRITRLRPDLD